MKITTWNVNSIRARLSHVSEWLAQNQPDFLCLQETKAQDQDFPIKSFEDLGYINHISGEKKYNGVSIHTKLPVKDVIYGLGDDETHFQKRVITVVTDKFYLINAYIPQGVSTDSPAFKYKLTFLEDLTKWAQKFIAHGDVVLCGDFNIAADDRDIFAPDLFRDQVMFTKEEHKAFSTFRQIGLFDSLRLKTEDEGLYTWWDYRGGAFRQNFGIRLDYIWLTQNLAGRLAEIQFDKSERKKEKPSDHIPYSIILDI